jgi:methionyl-tRNA formyltransferase
MRIVLFANNTVGVNIARWLRDRGDEIVAVVVHPEETQKRREEIVVATGVLPECAFDGATLADPAVAVALGRLSPDIGISAFFGYLLRAPILGLFPKGVINLHPSYLPYNRGHSPNVWSIIDGTPAGVTLHYIDSGVDTGDIIARRPVPVENHDTGETLYRRLERECVQLFKDEWQKICEGSSARSPQSLDDGTTHRGRDLAVVDRIDLDRHYTGREIIDILRARTFPPYDGAYFEVDGKRVYMRLQLWPDKLTDRT